jgi:hypothetical protein
MVRHLLPNEKKRPNLPSPNSSNPYPPARMPSTRPSASVGSRAQAGSYLDRQSRIEARSWRRYGDWSVLEIPTLLLWLDATAPPVCDGDSCETIF